MARIINVVTKETVILTPYNTFGRNPSTSVTCLRQADVSQSHATIFYGTDSCWYLKDHSRNGTVLDGEYLHHVSKKLVKKHFIQLGKDEISRWQILDLEPPFCYLKSLTVKEKIIKLSPVTAIPDGKNSGAFIYYLKEKGWVLEKEGSTLILEHGLKISLNNDLWEFVSNEVVTETIDHGEILKQAFFNFQLSLNEEHITLQLVVSDNQQIDLGNCSHNYLLLSLVRKKLQDQNLGISAEESGWFFIDDLLKDLSKEMGKEIDVYYLNLQIFRLRKLLFGLPSFNYVFLNVIERRLGEIRFGHPYFRIMKGQENMGARLPEGVRLSENSETEKQ